MTNHDIQINATESTIEDILCENMDKFLNLKFIQRQVKTPAGVIDILAKAKGNEGVYFVIELKKENIDDHTYVQSHRYCKYMNTHHNKDFKRVFIPLIIGNNLSDSLIKVVNLFDVSEEFVKSDMYNTYYACFGFNINSGISFNYHLPAQQDWQEEYYDGYGYFQNKIEDLQITMYRMENL